MLSFKDHLNESELHEANTLRVYHGDNFNTRFLDPTHMYRGGNNQEGAGIYFGVTPEVAETYGSHIIYADINPRNYVDSESRTNKHLSQKQLVSIMNGLYESDEETFFYLMSDYVYVTEPDEVEEYHIEEFAEIMGREQVRHFQNSLCESFTAPVFVKLWNQNTKIQGTVGRKTNFYAIIDPSVKVYPYRG